MASDGISDTSLPLAAEEENDQPGVMKVETRDAEADMESNKSGELQEAMEEQEKSIKEMKVEVK